MPTAVDYTVFDYQERGFIQPGGPAGASITFNHSGANLPPWYATALSAGDFITHRRTITANGPVGYEFAGNTASHNLKKMRFTMVDLWTSAGGQSYNETHSLNVGQLPFPLNNSVWQASNGGGETAILAGQVSGNGEWLLDFVKVCGEDLSFDPINIIETTTFTNAHAGHDSSTGSFTVFCDPNNPNRKPSIFCSYTWTDPQTTVTARYYDLRYEIVWEGPFYARVKFAPTDHEGNAITGLDMCQVTIGNIYQRVNPASPVTQAINKGTATTADLTKYFFVEDLPLDKQYNYPAKVTWRKAYALRRTIDGQFNGFDEVALDDYYNQTVRSGLTSVRIDLPRDKWYGLPATATPWQEGNIFDSTPMFLYHPDAQVTNVNLATLSLPQSRAFTAPTGWSIAEGSNYGTITNITGGQRFSVAAARSLATFRTPDGTGSFNWVFRPYRYVAFDYNVTQGSSVSITLRLDTYYASGATAGNTWYRKEFSVSLSGSGTYYVDTMQPDRVTASGPDSTWKAQAEAHNSDQITQENIAQAFSSLGVPYPMFDKWSGIHGISHIELAASGPSTTFEITNWRCECRYGATYNQTYWTRALGTGQEGFDGYSTYGQLDGRDWLRVRPDNGNQYISPQTFLYRLRDDMGLTLTNEVSSYALNSAWSSPTSWANLRPPSGQFSRHGITSPYTGTDITKQRFIDKSILETGVDVPFTMGGDSFQGFLGLQQTGVFNHPPFDGPNHPIVIEAWLVFGCNYTSTAVDKKADAADATGRKVRVHGTKADLATEFTEDSHTGQYGYLRHSSKVVRPWDWPNHPSDYPATIEHYSPDQPTPQVKQLLQGKGLRPTYWIGIGPIANGASIPSYDVMDNLNHVRSYVKASDRKCYFGWKPNAKADAWTDREVKTPGGASYTDPIMGSCVRAERSTSANRSEQGRPSGHRCHLLLSIDRPSTDDVVLQYTDDYGQTWRSGVTLTTSGRWPGLLVTRKGIVYAYWVDADGTIMYRTFDKSQQPLSAAQATNLTATNCDGLAVGEYVAASKKPYITLTVSNAGQITYYKSTDGKTFS